MKPDPGVHPYVESETPREWNAHRHHHRASAGAKRVTILIPTHNEERRVLATLAQLATFLHRKETSPWAFDVLVIDDGTDDTAKVVTGAAYALKLPLKVIHKHARMGKGGAVTFGIQHAKGTIVLLYDADGATPPHQIPKLLDTLTRSRADVAVGSRHAPGAKIGGVRKPMRKFMSRAFRTLVKSMFGLPLHDTQCGFKAFRKTPALARVLKETQATGFEWDVDVLARAHHAGLKLVEVPIEWNDAQGSTVKPSDTFKMLRGVWRVQRRLE